MGRKEERIKKQLEKNPIKECNKIQNKFYPELFKAFGETKDPRHASYIEYSNQVMLTSLYYKDICGISSMQEMTRKFNDDVVVKNIYGFINEEDKEYLPHSVTINEYLSKLNPGELGKIRDDIVKKMIRRKTFNDARILGKWLVIVDGTELDNTCKKKNDSYLERCYNKGTADEYVRYHRSVLEAKIYFGDNLLASIGTEAIENSEEYQRKKYTEEQIKQDCESKAFIRLAAKIKKSFPRLPICIVADGLYVSEKVMNICKDNDWDFIIRYKEGCAKSIEQEYKAIPEKEYAGDVEYVNEIVYKDGTVNFVKYKEKRVKKGEIITTEFKFITSIKVNKTNAKKIVVAGRNRWKIENQGFNRQKNWQGDIEHACSHNERAQKNHYLMEQIADFIKQLYEYFYLLKNGIKKMQKNISSELLASLATTLIAEDTNDKHCLSQN